ncbi:MAG: endonuclease domain-containing protein [Flavipsychrobacter sp.]
MRKIIPYNPKLKLLARQLRNNSTQSEIQLWKHLRNKQMAGFDFHRQKPIDNYILDFFCHELMLGIELDGITHQFEDVYERDMLKKNRMQELGITIMRFNDNLVLNDIANVLRTIEAYIEQYTSNASPLQRG